MRMLASHMAEFWLVIGVVLLAVELFVLGMASGVLLFAGVGGMVTGGLLWFGMIPAQWGSAILCFGLTTGVSVALLWKPFKHLQSDRLVDHTPTSDLVGLTFRLQQDIAIDKPGSSRYSGVVWRVEIAPGLVDQTIPSGTEVEVVSVDVGLFRVVPAHRNSS